MATDYRDYTPLVLDHAGATIERLKSADYRRFILCSTIEPGVRLLLARRKLLACAGADWPFVDTKFNPNSGADLPAESYHVVYCWFLGRGVESLAGHLPVLDGLPTFTPAERAEAAGCFRQLIVNSAAAIVRVMSANQGRCPFRVNREYKAIDENGQTFAISAKIRSGGDTFCAKGLIAEGSPGNVARGVNMLLDCANYVRKNAYGSDQGVDISGKIGQGERMLMMAAPLLVAGHTADPAQRSAILDLAAEFMRFVLDKHIQPGTGEFAEYLAESTGERLSYLDPGHANEFVGLGLGAVEAMEAEPGWLTDGRRKLIERAKAELPRVLVWSTGKGWNHKFHGLHKAVDGRTGQVLNDDMPWWNLPETMRAAARALEICRDEPLRAKIMDCFRLAHNGYFEHFLNRNNMLFPYQTRSGATGQVVNKVPAVPEGDPLYHTNLSLLDMLTVLRRVGR